MSVSRVGMTNTLRAGELLAADRTVGMSPDYEHVIDNVSEVGDWEPL